MVALGAATAEAFARISANLLFLGVTGVHADAGLTTGHAKEGSDADTARAARELHIAGSGP